MKDPHPLIPPQSPRETDDFLRSLYVEQGGVRGVFSSKVTDYVASRPDYPDALYDALRATGALSDAPSDVADLGAGTGLFSAGLLARGHRVVAVEPNAAMRAASDALLHSCEKYRNVAGSAEATTLEDGSVDLVTAAQAFHWFEIEATRRECLRILRPAGRVALIWNDRVLSDPFQAEIDAIFSEFGGPTRDALVARENRAAVPRFFGEAPTVGIDLPHEHALDRADLQSLVFSRSYMPLRDSETGFEAVRRLDAVFDKHAAGGSVVLRYRTVATIGRPESPKP
jgi:SAM-dependent methyltransferase